MGLVETLCQLKEMMGYDQSSRWSLVSKKMEKSRVKGYSNMDMPI